MEENGVLAVQEASCLVMDLMTGTKERNAGNACGKLTARTVFIVIITGLNSDSKMAVVLKEVHIDVVPNLSGQFEK